MTSRIREVSAGRPVLPFPLRNKEIFMRVRIFLATMIVAATPGLALAMCAGDHEKVTMSCPEGQAFDAESSTCKALPTG
jgi:hypothetical protein